MLKFNQTQATTKDIDSWIDANANIMLIGKHGVGKTERMKAALERRGINYAYFSGPLMDPFIHLQGVPYVDDCNSELALKFVMTENVTTETEVIIIDEYNRCPKLIRAALMELTLTKCINGKPFPKMRMVWGAINPEEDEYDVEAMDTAQLDRFQVIAEVADRPCRIYFSQKFGNDKAKAVIDWWDKETDAAKSFVSPRRLEYILSLHEKGVDVRYMIPECANASELISSLNFFDRRQNEIQMNLENPTDDWMKEFLSNSKNYFKYEAIFEDPRYFCYMQYVAPEHIADKLKKCGEYDDKYEFVKSDFRNYVCMKYLQQDPYYTALLGDPADPKYNTTEPTNNDFIRYVQYYNTVKMAEPEMDIPSFVEYNPFKYNIPHTQESMSIDEYDAYDYSKGKVTAHKQLIKRLVETWGNTDFNQGKRILRFLVDYCRNTSAVTVKNTPYINALVYHFYKKCTDDALRNEVESLSIYNEAEYGSDFEYSESYVSAWTRFMNEKATMFHGPIRKGHHYQNARENPDNLIPPYDMSKFQTEITS